MVRKYAVKLFSPLGTLCQCLYFTGTLHEVNQVAIVLCSDEPNRMALNWYGYPKVEVRD